MGKGLIGGEERLGMPGMSPPSSIMGKEAFRGHMRLAGVCVGGSFRKGRPKPHLQKADRMLTL